MNKNYVPGSMSFASSFLGPRGDVGYHMNVDEQKAIKIVQGQIKLGRDIERAELGLDGDWIENNTEIYDGKEFHKYDSYGCSIWATPLLIIYYNDAPSESYECWTKGED